MKEPIDRLPPHSQEAEQGVLGSIMLGGSEVVDECIEIFGGAEVFYDLRHQEIYEAMLSLHVENKPIDLINLHEVLKKRNKLENVGGLSYISGLTDYSPSAANVTYWADIIEEKYRLRKFIHVATDGVSEVYEGEQSADAIIGATEQKLLDLSKKNYKDARPIIELVQHAVEEMERVYQLQGTTDGIPTGYTDIDKLTGGLHAGEMTIIAARPSVGKTSLALNIASNISVRDGVPGVFFSLEMPAQRLTQRIILADARINYQSLRSGMLSQRDFGRIATSSAKVSRSPLFIEEKRGLTTTELRSKARRYVRKYGVKYVVVDYLQLLHSSRLRNKRHEEVSDVSSSLHALAGDLDIPVIALSQLSRDTDKSNKPRRPVLADLRESGSIEQDADNVWLLYSDYESPSSDEGTPVICHVAKQRNGPTDRLYLTFLRGFTRFESAASVSWEDSIPELPKE